MRGRTIGESCPLESWGGTRSLRPSVTSSPGSPTEGRRSFSRARREWERRHSGAQGWRAPRRPGSASYGRSLGERDCAQLLRSRRSSRPGSRRGAGAPSVRSALCALARARPRGVRGPAARCACCWCCAAQRSPRTCEHRDLTASDRAKIAARSKPTASMTARTSSIRSSSVGTAVGNPIRQARTALVEEHEPREGGEPTKEPRECRILREVLDVGDEARHEHEVHRAFS